MASRRTSRRQFLGSAALLASTSFHTPALSPAAPHTPLLPLVPEPPLPPGVARQFGPARFRDFARVIGRFSADSRWLIDYAHHRCAGYELTTGRRVQFGTPPRGAEWTVDNWLATTDGRLTIIEKNGDDSRLRRFDLTTGAAVPVAEFKGKRVQAVSSDGRVAVLEGEAGVWGVDVLTGKTRWEPRPGGFVHLLEPTGSFAAVGVVLGEENPDYVLRLLDPLTGRLATIARPAGATKYEIHARWVTADHTRLVAHVTSTVGEVRRVGTWDTGTGRLLAEFAIGERERVIGPTADGKGVFVAVGDSRQLAIRDGATGKIARRFEVFDVFAVDSAVTPDGKTLLLASPVPTGGKIAPPIRRLSADTGLSLPLGADPPGPLVRVWFPNRTTVGTGFRTAQEHLDFQLWDVPTGRGRRAIDSQPVNETVERTTFRDLTDAVSPTGRLIRLDDRRVSVFDARGVKVASSADLPSGLFRFWLDANTVGVLNQQGLHTWDTATGKVRTTPVEFAKGSFPRHCRLTPDGRTLALHVDGLKQVGRFEIRGSVAWLDVATGKLSLTNAHAEDTSPTFSVSADGERVMTRKTVTAEERLLLTNSFPPTPVPHRIAVHQRDGCRWTVTPDERVLHQDLSGCGRTLVVQTALNRNQPEKPFLATLELWEVASDGMRHRYAAEQPHDDLRASPCGRFFATVRADTPVYLWDIYGETSDPRPQPTANDLPRLWADLARPEADKAFVAVRTLVQHPAATVELLSAKVKPAEVPAAEWVATRIARLSDRHFHTRQAAERELSEVSDVCGEQLKNAAELAETPEAEERLTRLAAAAGRPSDLLRKVRAVEVLEFAEGKAAGDLLAKLAGGAEGAVLTREAATALRRRRWRG
jgi:hypothetical protein